MSIVYIKDIILRFYPYVEAIYLFGTYGTNDECPESDVDIAVLLPMDEAKKAGSLFMCECKQVLEDILKRTVDLINIRVQNTVFQHEIITEGRIIFNNNEYAVDLFEMHVMSLYQKLNEERANILEEIYKTGRILQP